MLRVLIRRAFRSPAWWCLALTSGAWAALLWLAGGCACSLGEFGRVAARIAQGPAAVFVALLASGLVKSELGHREVSWTTGATPLKMLVLMNVGTSLASLLAIVVGVACALLPVSVVAGRFTLVGAELTIVYLLWTMMTLLLWTSLATFLRALLKSEWGAVPMLAIVWLVVIGVLARILEPSVFAPFGVLPYGMLLSGLVALGMSLLGLGATLFLFGLWPEWTNAVADVRPILLVGVATLSGGVLAMSIMSREKTAPFSFEDLWAGRAFLSRPYVWDRDGQRLLVGNTFLALRLPAGATLPLWAEERKHHGWEVYAYEVGLPLTEKIAREGSKMIHYRHLEKTLLVMVYPAGKTYPDELRESVACFLKSVRPIIERAELWWRPREQIRLTVVPSEPIGPHGDPLFEGIHVFSSGLLVPERTITGWAKREKTEALWGTAWAIAEGAGLGSSERAYLAFYLMQGSDPKETEDALKKWRQREQVQIARGVRVPAPTMSKFDLTFRATGTNGLEEVLEHWQRGEELGHENYIRTLLEGDN